MPTKCPKCGMDSDRDDLCTWCNADIPAKKQASKKAEGAPPGGRAPAGPPAAGAPARTEPGAAPAPRRSRTSPPPPPPKPEKPAWMLPAIIGGGALLAIIGALVFMGVAASGAPPEPGEWESFTSKDNSFSAYYPKGWGEPSNSGAAGSYVLVEWKGTKLCRVTVRGTQAAGAKGDIAAAKERAAMAALGPGETLAVEDSADGALLMGFVNETWNSKHAGYEESAPQFSYGFAKTRSAYVEYTFSTRVGLMSIPMKGMRWASAQGDYGYHVVAEAPAKHWDAFSKTANQIVSGVQMGAGGG